MSELPSPYVFCESAPRAVIERRSADNPRTLIMRALDGLTEMMHDQPGPYSGAEQRAIASLQAALYHLGGDYA